MMAYRLRPIEAFHRGYSIDAGRRVRIPGVECPNCGIWTSIGVMYPTLETGPFELFLRRYAPPRVASLDEFAAIIGHVSKNLARPYRLVPGTGFGPLAGEMKGKPRNLSWQNPWTMLMTESLCAQAEEAGFLIPSVSARLSCGGRDAETLREPEILPLVSHHEETLNPACKLCGRIGGKVPKAPILLAGTYDETVALQRIRDMETVIVASEEFANFLKLSGVEGFTATPLEVV